MSIGNGTASYNLCDGGGAFNRMSLTSSPLDVNAAAFTSVFRAIARRREAEQPPRWDMATRPRLTMTGSP